MVAAIVSTWNYRRNSQRARAQWLFELYKRFWDDADLRAMATALDWGETGFVSDLEKPDRELSPRLDAYLNFFEFVGYLHHAGQLKTEEIKDMFNYPLETLARDGRVLAYVKKYGYERTDELLKKMVP